jgi:HEAT repeat protein
MLGWIGGPEIVPPLTMVIESSDSQTLKINALESLYAAPPEDALPVVQKCLESDANRYVREKASRVLARLKDRMKG